MEKLEFRIPPEGQRRLISELAQQYANPLHALREYIVNSIDAIDDGKIKDSLIKILLSPKGRRIIVEDNAYGMDEEKVRSLPVQVGNSAKFGRIDQRGEKAVGLLAFGSVGHMIHIVTKTKGEQMFNYLRYEKKDEEVQEPVFDRFTTDTVNREQYGVFPCGTRVILDTNTDIFRKNLTESAIERFVQETFFPLMQTRRISMKIGDADIGSTRKIQEPEIAGDILLNENLTFKAKSKRDNEPKDYDLFAYLVFNPDIENGKVAVFSKDVKVYNSIVQLEESLADLDFWRCRQITGYINEPNLKITLGREGINRDSNAYRGLVNLLEEIHNRYWPQISDQIKRKRFDKGNKLIDNVWKELEEVYKITDPLDKQTRGQPEKRPKGENDKDKRKQGGCGGDRERKFPFQYSQMDFGLGEEELRSRLDTDSGYPIIQINTSHRDYIRIVVDSRDKDVVRDYIFDITAPQIALWEARRRIERGGTLGDPYEMSARISGRTQDLKYAPHEKNGKRRNGD